MCSDESSVTVTDAKSSVTADIVTAIFTRTANLSPPNAYVPILSCPPTTWKANDPGNVISSSSDAHQDYDTWKGSVVVEKKLELLGPQRQASSGENPVSTPGIWEYPLDPPFLNHVPKA